MNAKSKILVDLVTTSLHRTENNLNDLNKDILMLEGMSGSLYRKFINDLVKSAKNINYLEIGCWKGSTLISALYNNIDSIKGYLAIDSWHEFGGPKNEFVDRCKKFLKQEPKLIDNNCFALDVNNIGIKEVDIYFYDGGHSELDHTMALTHYASVCNDQFIYIVDDYNWPSVIAGTYKGIIKSNLKIVHDVSKYTSANGTKDTWWNGVGIFVLEK